MTPPHQVPLDLPAGAGRPPPAQVINVDIDFDGRVFWNGAPAETDRRLEQWFRGAGIDPLHPSMRIWPDRHAPYERVVQVLAAAQRAHVTRLALSPVAD